MATYDNLGNMGEVESSEDFDQEKQDQLDDFNNQQRCEFERLSRENRKANFATQMQKTEKKLSLCPCHMDELSQCPDGQGFQGISAETVERAVSIMTAG